MLFTTLDFGLFLPLVFIVYWALSRIDLQVQNVLLVVVSYVFYGWWDWRFLILIFLSSVIDFAVGEALGKSEHQGRRKLLLWTSLACNLGMLGFFKYHNFFIENFAAAFSFFGREIPAERLDLILPVGISFYTFQTLSYTIDVYRRKLQPAEDPFQFLAFVSFFPQLVAGPIERARDLLPQFNRRRVFHYDQAVDGCRQILWGLVKKVVVADNCAHAIQYMFEKPTEVEPGELFLGALLFFIQVYGDFSGYSDIAIGLARLFGFQLSLNFSFPLFSRNLVEFWQRWHITLTHWLRDYLFIPMGGSRGSTLKTIRNVMIVFVLSGWWHGPDWKYITWGGLHGVAMIVTVALPFRRRYQEVVAYDGKFPAFREIFGILFTFLMLSFITVFFRSKTVPDALAYLYLMGSDPLSWLSWSVYSKYISLLVTVGLFFLIEWKGRREAYGLARLGWKWPRMLRWALYLALGLVVIHFNFSRPPVDFIYFQF